MAGRFVRVGKSALGLARRVGGDTKRGAVRAGGATKRGAVRAGGAVGRAPKRATAATKRYYGVGAGAGHVKSASFKRRRIVTGVAVGGALGAGGYAAGRRRRKRS